VGYGGREHPLAKQTQIEIKDMNADELLLLKEGHCFRDQAQKVCPMVTRESQGPIQFSSGNL